MRIVQIEKENILDAVCAHRDKTWLIIVLSSLIPELFQAMAEPHGHRAHTNKKERERERQACHRHP